MYFFIFSKKESFKQIDEIENRQEFCSISDYNTNKLTNNYTRTLAVDQEFDQNLDNEVIDLTKDQNKESNLIEIPICLIEKNEKPATSKFVAYNKPRIVSTTFITPVNDSAYSYANNNSNVRISYGQQDSDSENFHMTVTKPQYIYYYDDESFGGY